MYFGAPVFGLGEAISISNLVRELIVISTVSTPNEIRPGSRVQDWARHQCVYIFYTSKTVDCTSAVSHKLHAVPYSRGSQLAFLGINFDRKLSFCPTFSI